MAAHFSTHSASIGPGDSGQHGSGQFAPCIPAGLGNDDGDNPFAGREKVSNAPKYGWGVGVWV